MKRWMVLLLAAAPALAAISGTVINRTANRPQAGVTVGFYKLENGLELVEEARTDARGAFAINRDLQGPALLRATVEGVTYTLTLEPGSPTTGVALNVYDASPQPGVAKVSKHMILFQPAGGTMGIKETFLYSNAGNVTWHDPRNGDLRFFMPAAAGGKVEVNATAVRA